MANRSYAQFCGLARTLDVIGDRWTLLIIRELLVRPARYGELLESLPGVPTNLLAARLRQMETDGLVERRFAPRGGVAYSLTTRGAQLRELIEAAMRWSTPLMVRGPGTDAFRPQWLVVALRGLLRGRRSSKRRTVAIEVGDALVTASVNSDGVTIEMDGSRPAHAVIRSQPGLVLGVASGVLPLDQVITARDFEGDWDAIATLFGPREIRGRGPN